MRSELQLRDSISSSKGAARKRPGKSPALVATTLGLWLGSLLVLGRDLWPVTTSPGNIVQRLVLLAFSGLLIVFWLLGSYYISLVVFYAWQKRRRPRLVHEVTAAHEFPLAAILYPTCDDLQRESVISCLDQDYPSFHVFVLDDSRSEQYMSAADALQEEFPGRLTVIRRSIRQGYKAGNLNHALKGVASAYPMFAVMDADEMLPRTFLRDMVELMSDTDYAFAQAKHVPNPDQPTGFARLMGQTIMPFWSVLLAVKNRYGFVPCVGHGVLVRRSAWEAAGGFPEVASEDLAFSAKLLEQGLRGVYADHVICWEDFAACAASFRIQQERYVAGVFQVLTGFWPKLLRRKDVSWTERLDFLLGSLPLYVPVLCLAFILVNGLAIPLCFGRIGTITVGLQDSLWQIPYWQSFDGRFMCLWRPLFVAISVIFSLSPALPMLAIAVEGRVRHPLRLIVASNAVYMSTMLASLWSLARCVIRVPVQFLPTGSRIATNGKQTNGRSASLVAESALALLVGGLLISSLNLGLAGLALCPLLGSCCISDEGRARAAAVVVFTGIMLQLVLGAAACHAPVSIPPLVSSIHF